MRTSRWLLASGVTVAVAAGLLGYHSYQREAPEGPTLTRVAGRGELLVCTTGDYPPFTLRDGASDRYRGIDIDMAGDLARALGVRERLVRTEWGTLVNDLTRGRCDLVMGGVSVTADRARHAAFSVPYQADGKTPITRCGREGKFATLDRIDRPGVRVVVNPGGTNERFARERLRRAELRVHPDNRTIFGEILAGRADLMITDAVETRYQARTRPGLCAVHPDRPFTRSQKAYLLPAGDPAFKARVDRWLSEALADGRYQRYGRAWT